MSAGDGGGEGIRLQRVLASAGLGSRRHCEELIGAGRVSVDGRRVATQGMRIDPETAEVRVDGIVVPTRSEMVYLLLNKPAGMLCTMHDEMGRRCVGDLVEGRRERVFHVGRLDADSEGLLLLTNDGELGHRLTHPSYEVPKTYLAEVDGPLARDAGRRMTSGILLDGVAARAHSFRVIDSAGNRLMAEVVVHEGRKHVVRRMFEEIGHPVHRLIRVRLGPLGLGELRPGNLRRLGQEEVRALYAAVQDRPQSGPPGGSKSPRPVGRDSSLAAATAESKVGKRVAGPETGRRSARSSSDRSSARANKPRRG